MKKFLTILLLLAAFNLAQAQTSDESYKKALVKLFEASNTTSTFRIAISSLFKTIKKSRSDVDESTWNTLEEEMGNLTADDFAEIYLDTYKPLLTERDLTEITKFYESPSGKKYITALPIIMGSGEKIAGRMLDIIIKKMEKQLYDER